MPCTARTGRRTTSGAPSVAPTTAAAMHAASRIGSTRTRLMKISACAIVGSAWPLFNVAGRKLSGISLRNFSQAVVGANEPMPSVSKKFVTAPSAIASALGRSCRAGWRPDQQYREVRECEHGERHEQHDDDHAISLPGELACTDFGGSMPHFTAVDGTVVNVRRSE